MSNEMNLWLHKITYEFSQEGNTDGTTEEMEELTVEIQSCTGSIEKEGGYLVLRTKTGWSINDATELVELLDLVEKGVNLKK